MLVAEIGFRADFDPFLNKKFKIRWRHKAHSRSGRNGSAV
jgi:hypothetical protein